MANEKPCLTCIRVKDPKNCENKKCQEWQRWYFQRWQMMRTVSSKKRLIDTVDTVTKISKKVQPLLRIGGSTRELYDTILGCIAEASTVDAVEVVHGRWEQVGDYYVCGDYCYRCTNCMTDEWMTFAHMKRFLYCPFCGAKMDGGNEDG